MPLRPSLNDIFYRGIQDLLDMNHGECHQIGERPKGQRKKDENGCLDDHRVQGGEVVIAGW